MTTEQLTEAFEVWWETEGKYTAPETSHWLNTKQVVLTAWLNGAHIATLDTQYVKVNI